MPHPGQRLVRMDFSAPDHLDRAAQQVAWTLDLEKREVLRIALALGLDRLGGLFEVTPETVAVKRGRP